MVKNQKGITLVALVITIIVLLILAAVSINAALGQNGIFTKATTAAENNAKGEFETAVKLEVLAYTTETLDPSATGYYQLSSVGATADTAGAKTLTGYLKTKFGTTNYTYAVASNVLTMVNTTNANKKLQILITFEPTSGTFTVGQPTSI